MRPIFLIGYMGCGKSTLGRMVSSLTGISFIDLDNYIEGRYHASVSQLFAERGERGFRDIERAMLHEVGEFEDVIVACGGGTPCFFDNMDYRNQQGLTVYLKADPEVLYNHLLMGKVERPLIKGKSPEELITFIRQQLEKREPFYTKANYTLDVSLMDNYEKIKISVDKIKELLDL